MFSYDIKILDDNTISEWIRGKGMSSLDYLLKVLVAIIVFYLIAKVLRVIAVTVQKRLDVYHSQTQPLIQYYREQGVLHSIDETKEMHEVFRDISSILD